MDIKYYTSFRDNITIYLYILWNDHHRVYLVNFHHHTWLNLFSYGEKFKIYFLSNFQIHDTVLLMLFTVLYIISCTCMLSHFSGVWLCTTLSTVAHQAPLSMEFSSQECWSRLPVPSPGDLPGPVIEPRPAALQAGSLLSEPPGKVFCVLVIINNVAMNIEVHISFQASAFISFR